MGGEGFAKDLESMAPCSSPDSLGFGVESDFRFQIVEEMEDSWVDSSKVGDLPISRFPNFTIVGKEPSPMIVSSLIGEGRENTSSSASSSLKRARRSSGSPLESNKPV